MTIPLGPVDPNTMSVVALRRRARALLAAPSLVPSESVPDGHYRCGLCLRVLAQEWSDEEANAAALARGTAPRDGDEVVVLCDDCDRIVGAALGYRP